MKWADVDSDSDEEHHHPVNQQAVEPEPKEEIEEEEVLEEEEELPPKEYDWPTEPPYTAYCGNLPFAIKESQHLDIAIQDILHDRFQASVTIVQSRLATDRETNKPRGFGYIELETVGDLQTVMRLNDGKSMIKGRPLKLDVAAPPQNNRRPSRSSLNRSNSSGEKVDGSSFRGGRYNRRDGSSSSLHRQSSISSDTSEGRQRLKLAPRSKPLEEKESSQSSLFGSGKARNAGEWDSRRSSEPKQQDRRDSAASNASGGERRGSTSSNNAGGERRGSATGGRGRGGGGRGRGKTGANKSSGRGDGGRGRGGKGGKDDKKKQKPKEKEEDEALKTVLKVQPAAEPPKASIAKVQNKFSALNMDSDSD